MSAEVILEEYAEEMGWNDRSKVLLLCQYIDNQGSDAALEDFLTQQRDEELDANHSRRRGRTRIGIGQEEKQHWKPEKAAVDYTDEELKKTPLYVLVTEADGTSPGKVLPLNLPEIEALRLAREAIDELRRLMGHKDDPKLPPGDIKLAKISGL